MLRFSSVAGGSEFSLNAIAAPPKTHPTVEPLDDRVILQNRLTPLGIQRLTYCGTSFTS